jgi:hypothetical protein
MWENGDNRVIEWSTCRCHFGGREEGNGTSEVSDAAMAKDLVPVIANYGFTMDRTPGKKVVKENSWASVEWDEEMVRKLVLTEGSGSEDTAVEGSGDLPATIWIVEEGLGIHRDSRRVVVGKALGV